MKCTDYIVQRLAAAGVNTIFGYTGGSIADLIDSIYRSDDVCFAATHHEQAAAFAACAYGRVRKSLGVALSSSGPGACNLLGGVANAYFDSLPILFITGNVHSLARNKFPGVRQSSFQEMNIVEMAKGITKYACELTSAEDVPRVFDEALTCALSGRPGPVLIDIPYNIQRSELSPPERTCVQNILQINNKDISCIDDNTAENIKQWLFSGKKPLVLLGGGCRNASHKIMTFLQQHDLPSVCTLRGIDIIPHSCHHFAGFVGSYGNRHANLAVKYCDRLLILGARLDERVMGWKSQEFAPDAQVVQVDIDEAELKKNSQFHALLRSDISCFIDALFYDAERSDRSHIQWGQWLKILSLWKERYPSETVTDNVSVNGFIKYLSSNSPANTIFCSDVGQHQMSIAQSIRLSGNSLLLNSAGYGSMGYSLPAAIGAAFASPGTPVISLNGDGGLQMNIQELQTLQREDLPVTVIVFNNNGLGLIRQLQRKMFNGRFYASEEGFSNPDFGKIADAYNMDYLKIGSMEDYIAAVKFIREHKKSVIEVIVPAEDKNSPEPGDKIYNQTPLLTDREIAQIEEEAKTCL